MPSSTLRIRGYGSSQLGVDCGSSLPPPEDSVDQSRCTEVIPASYAGTADAQCAAKTSQGQYIIQLKELQRLAATSTRPLDCLCRLKSCIDAAHTDHDLTRYRTSRYANPKAIHAAYISGQSARRKGTSGDMARPIGVITESVALFKSRVGFLPF